MFEAIIFHTLFGLAVGIMIGWVTAPQRAFEEPRQITVIDPTWSKLVVEHMKTITHLEKVIRRKDRKIRGLRNTLGIYKRMRLNVCK